LGKKYIGIDISEEYVEYAKRRLENAEKEKARVLKELSLHSIELTFKERKERGFWNKRA
jgi:modification methylase